MNFDYILISTSVTLFAVFSMFSNINFITTFNWQNLSTSAWNISSRLNGYSIFALPVVSIELVCSPFMAFAA